MKRCCIAALAVASAHAWAHPLPQAIVITGNPLGAREVALPSSVLSGDGLTLRRAGTLGETLDGLPGVSSSWFGPNANRPVIRGQDGDRIRMLNNAGASLDASALSFDHAVPIDPLVVERVEVLRGPAALLYGGSAVGGVVNAIDNRIPKAPVDGVTGAAEVGLGGAASQRSGSALVEFGGQGFALHADAFKRRTDDLHVPDFEVPLEDGSTERRDRVVNSASDAQGGAVGGSFLWGTGYLGASVEGYRNDYGIVAEEDITIRMRRDRVALAGEWRPGSGFIRTWRAQAARTDYEHREIEGDGSVGTTFATSGNDGRLEAVHRALALGGGSLEGTFGLQFESSRFSALGEEAFVPSTHTRHTAAFALERWTWGERGHLAAGVRLEDVNVRSDGDAPDTPPRFGPAQERSFTPASASLGGVLQLDARWQLLANASYTERAPTSYELYANGVHVATAAFERGDPQQQLERGRNLDLGVGWRDGPNRLRIGIFDSRFQNYIALSATGEPDVVTDEGDAFPVYAFRGTRARLQGVEAEAGWRLMTGARNLDLDASLDSVRGTDEDAGQPLPRLPPWRATVGITLTQGPWMARAEVRHAAEQTRVPATDTATPDWTQFNLEGSYRIRLGGTEGLLFAKARNLGDALAYNATSIGTVRPLSPLPGRSLAVGLRLGF